MHDEISHFWITCIQTSDQPHAAVAWSDAGVAHRNEGLLKQATDSIRFVQLDSLPPEPEMIAPSQNGQTAIDYTEIIYPHGDGGILVHRSIVPGERTRFIDHRVAIDTLRTGWLALVESPIANAYKLMPRLAAFKYLSEQELGPLTERQFIDATGAVILDGSGVEDLLGLIQKSKHPEEQRWLLEASKK